jgi:hypothetical protein
LNWSQTGERKFFGPALVKVAEEKVRVIKENFRITQKDKRVIMTRERHLGDTKLVTVYLKVSPTKGVQRFSVKGKLAPRYIGPYEIIQVCGPVAYRLRLPERFSVVHNVFHVSQLRKCAHEPAREVIEEANASIEPDLSVVEHPLRILDVKERKTRRQTVKMYKIQWSHHTIEEATWETQHYFNENYLGFLESRHSKVLPLLHPLTPNLGTRFLLWG